MSIPICSLANSHLDCLSKSNFGLIIWFCHYQFRFYNVLFLFTPARSAYLAQINLAQYYGSHYAQSS